MFKRNINPKDLTTPQFTVENISRNGSANVRLNVGLKLNIYGGGSMWRCPHTRYSGLSGWRRCAGYILSCGRHAGKLLNQGIIIERVHMVHS